MIVTNKCNFLENIERYLDESKCEIIGILEDYEV